jgi:hypothetical protein
MTGPPALPHQQTFLLGDVPCAQLPPHLQLQQQTQQRQRQQQAAAGAALEQVSRAVMGMSPWEQEVWRQRVSALSAHYSQPSVDSSGINSFGNSSRSGSSGFSSAVSSGVDFGGLGSGGSGAWGSGCARGGGPLVGAAGASEQAWPEAPPLAEMQAAWADTAAAAAAEAHRSGGGTWAGNCSSTTTSGSGSSASGHSGAATAVPAPSGDAPDAAASLVVVGGLGRGGYASVVAAQHTRTHVTYALKCVHKAGARRAKDRLRLARELLALTTLPPCPFVVACHGAFETSRAVFFVLDLVDGGDLFYHLASLTRAGRAGFGERAGRFIVAQCALGLLHFHAHRFLHRDLKVGGRQTPAARQPRSSKCGLMCVFSFRYLLIRLFFGSPIADRGGAGGEHHAGPQRPRAAR